MKENLSRWFGHVQWKSVSAPVKRSDRMVVTGDKDSGRPKRTRMEAVQKDMLSVS